MEERKGKRKETEIGKNREKNGTNWRKFQFWCKITERKRVKEWNTERKTEWQNDRKTERQKDRKTER